jgi:acetyl-CoA acyltransferase
MFVPRSFQFGVVRDVALRWASGGRVVLVDGVRTPFQLSNTGFDKLSGHQLQTVALRAILDRNPSLRASDVDCVICGTVIQEVKTSNIAREAALAAGFPDRVPAHTVTQACISSNQAISQGIGLIRSGAADIIISGGVETMSDVPIRFSKKLRKRMIASTKAKSIPSYIKLLRGFSFSEFIPELPAIAEFSSVCL